MPSLISFIQIFACSENSRINCVCADQQGAMAELIFLTICGIGAAFLIFAMVNWWMEWRRDRATASPHSVDVDATIAKIRKRIVMNRTLPRH